MKCKNCGTSFNEGTFCPECGTRYELEENTSVSKEIIEKTNTPVLGNKSHIHSETISKEKEKKRYFIPIIIIAVVVLAVIGVFIFMVLGSILLIGISEGSTSQNTEITQDAETMQDTEVEQNDELPEKEDIPQKGVTGKDQVNSDNIHEEEVKKGKKESSSNISNSEKSYNYEGLEFIGFYEGSEYAVSFSAYTEVDSDEIGTAEIYYQGNYFSSEPVYFTTDWGDWSGWDYDALYVIYVEDGPIYLGFSESNGMVELDFNSENRNIDTLSRTVDYNTESTDSSEYILPNSSSELISVADLEGLTKEQCRLARNEIYARHGKIFQSADLNDYFCKTSWYISDEGFNESCLSKIEKDNINTIVKYEESKGYQ